MRNHSKNNSKEFVDSSHNSLSKREPLMSSFKEVRFKVFFGNIYTSKKIKHSNTFIERVLDKVGEVLQPLFGDDEGSETQLTYCSVGEQKADLIQAKWRSPAFLPLLGKTSIFFIT